MALACAGALLLMSTAATAQDAGARNIVVAQATEREGFFERAGRWWDDSVDWMTSGFRGARDRVKNLGQEAGTAARTSADTAKTVAKDTADAVKTIPNTRIVSGHEVCPVAPNGAPDCIAAVLALCRSKGFKTGSSLSSTTAEKCPPQVLLAGRTGAPGECKSETFISRAICK